MAERSACTAEGRRTSRLRGQIIGFANSQSAQRWLRNGRLAISNTDVPAFDFWPSLRETVNMGAGSIFLFHFNSQSLKYQVNFYYIEKK